MRTVDTFLLCAVAVLSFGVNSEPCDDVFIDVLGSGGPELSDGRRSTSYLIWKNFESIILVDAGAGSSVAFGEAGGDFGQLKAILFSHLHVDHTGDLPAYIKGSYFTQRTDRLFIRGPAGNELMPSTTEFVHRLFGSKGAYSYLSGYLAQGEESYLLDVADITPDSERSHPFQVNDDINTRAISVHHGPIPALSWRVSLSGCEIAFTGDMNTSSKGLSAFATGADLLVVHNAINEQAGSAAKNLHATPEQLIDLIGKAKPKKVLLSHFMRRSVHNRQALRDLIEKQLGITTVLAEDRMRVSIN